MIPIRKQKYHNNLVKYENDQKIMFTNCIRTQEKISYLLKLTMLQSAIYCYFHLESNQYRIE